ncbi:MAG: hypothetical protein E7277_07665, partial [Lachnospiraceae bacterium]|nr:hypothetical protein [Lachnospiraceae bacterium]
MNWKMGRTCSIFLYYAQRDWGNGQNHRNYSGLCPGIAVKWAEIALRVPVMPSVTGGMGRTIAIVVDSAQRGR